MLTILSLNTALDRTLVVPDFSPGGVYRANTVLTEAGGKGLNVARVLRQLDVPVRVVGFLGGTVAPSIAHRVAQVGIEAEWVRIAGETRTCIIVADPHQAEQTVLNEPGPWVSPQEIDTLRQTLRSTLQPGDILAISGSTPPGVPQDFYAEIVRSFPLVRVLVDARGPALHRALHEHPWAATPNLDEARTAVQGETPHDIIRALHCFSSHVLLTLGAQGILAHVPSGLYHVEAPHVPTRNAVGSGDACVAGFLAASQTGASPLQAVRLAAACGAANAARLEGSIGSRAEIEQLLTAVRVLQLDPSPCSHG